MKLFSKELIASLILVMVLSARAEVVQFPEVWQKIKINSPIQESARLQQKSLNESEARASKHWLPHIYLDARSYRTNDPGNAFLGLLEQRRVEASDFNPDSLNQPDAATFNRATLGLDLPLYEGGMKVNQVSMYSYAVKAQEFASSQIEIDQYSKVGQSYASIMVLQTQLEKLNVIDAEIKKLLKSYQIGQKSNPVGYSGLLGMKSLANRLAGLAEQYRAQAASYAKALAAMGFDQENWQTEKTQTLEFVNKYFTMSSKATSSNQLLAQKQNAQAVAAMADMERARFLPRLGYH